MSFYLLKSSYERQEAGDVLIDAHQVESFTITSKKFKDTEKEIFIVRIVMRSKDYWTGRYTSLNEAKKVIKEIAGEEISDKDLKDLIAHTLD